MYTAADFDDMDPAKVFAAMKLLTKATGLPRLLPESYKSWDKLTNNQPKTVQKFYADLPANLKELVVTKVASMAVSVTLKKSLGSKNQLARIAELRAFPGFQMYSSVGRFF